MRAPRTIAIATGVMIGFGVIAPVANAQVPAVQSASVVAHNGNGAIMREARQAVRDARQLERTTFHEAKQALREALRAARESFHAAIRQANQTFRASVAASRETLLAVVQDPASTDEQREAARDTFKAEVQQAREVRRAAVKDAIADYKAAREEARQAFLEAIGK